MIARAISKIEVTVTEAKYPAHTTIKLSVSMFSGKRDSEPREAWLPARKVRKNLTK